MSSEEIDPNVIELKPSMDPSKDIHDQGYNRYIEFLIHSYEPCQQVTNGKQAFRIERMPVVVITYAVEDNKQVKESPEPVLLLEFPDYELDDLKIFPGQFVRSIQYKVSRIISTEIPHERGEDSKPFQITFSKYISLTLKSMKLYPLNQNKRASDIFQSGASLLILENKKAVLVHEEYPTREQGYNFRVEFDYLQ